MYKLRQTHPTSRMPFATAATIVCALALLTGAPSARAQAPGGTVGEGEVVVDRVVAVVQVRAGVGGRIGQESGRALAPEVITWSMLEFETRVALIQQGAIRAATEPLDTEALQSALEHAIDQRLLAGEAAVLEAWQVEPAEVETALRAFRDRFESEAAFRAFLARHEADTQTLARVLERDLRAVKVLDSKVRLRAQVSEAEVRRYYDAHRAEIPGTYDEVRAALREKLVRERSAQLVQRELEQLRRTHDVRRIAPLAREGAGRGRG